MTISGPGIFFDGVTTARHVVAVELAPAGLSIRAADGTILAEWHYNELDHRPAPSDVLRLGRAGSDVLARLEVRDPDLAAAIDESSLPIDRSGVSERRMRMKVIAWSLAATLSLVLVAILGVPRLATRLTPLVPVSIERKFGTQVEAQVRRSLDSSGTGKAFECGRGAREVQGQAAFEKLMGTLEMAAGLPTRLEPLVVRKEEPNAFALPGGHVFVFKGLINQARTPDELAGVIAHEIGHAAHRDGLRTVLQSAGISFLFGVLLGDFFGGGATVLAAKTLLRDKYSREVEAAADGYSVMLMSEIGGDPRALGQILLRIAGSRDSPRILLDHPDTRDRVAAIEAMAGSGPTRPLLDASEWAALKNICAGS